MKRIFTLSIFAVLFIVSGKSPAQVFLEENFDYPAGDSIGAHGWVSFSGGATNVLTVVSPGLTYSGYPLSGIGNAVQINETGQDAYKPLGSDVTSGAVYTAFMVNVDTAKSGDYFLAYLPSTSTTNYTGRVYAKDSLGMLSFGLSRTTAAAGGIFYTPPIYQYETTYLLVLKYDFNSGTTTDDEVSLFVFINPIIPPIEPAIPNIGPLTGTATDLPNVGRVALRQATASTTPELVLDGIKSFGSWVKITAINNVSSVAEDFRLYQNYPNPFNPSTTIKLSVPNSGKIVLNIYNSLGQIVSELANANVPAGSYSVDFNAKGLNSGVYFYTLAYTGDNGVFYTDTKKLLLIK